MKAAIYHGIGDMRVEECPKPRIRAGELLVRVRACAVCGGDLRTFRHGHPKIHPPVILGHEFAGVVAEVGADAPSELMGARIVAAPAIGCGACAYCRAGHTHLCGSRETIGFSMDGAFAEYVRIPARAVQLGNVQHIPDDVDDLSAALTEPLACVVNGQEALGIGTGDTVAVIGAGPIGILHAELARAAGARVLLLNRSAQRLADVHDMGYDAYIETGADGGVQAVLDVTDGRGADVVIVTAGSAAAMAAGIAMTARMGRVSLFAGLPQDAPPLPLDVNLIHYRQIALHGAFSSAPRHNARALEYIRSGQVRAACILTHAVALSDIARGFDLVEQRAGLRVAILPHPEEMAGALAQHPQLHTTML